MAYLVSSFLFCPSKHPSTIPENGALFEVSVSWLIHWLDTRYVKRQFIPEIMACRVDGPKEISVWERQ